MMSEDTFQGWVVREVQEVLGLNVPSPPLLLWLDPDREWLDLLRAAAEAGGFELWADRGQHELTVRDRFCREPRAPRVVWLPCGREDVTWFKPFELEAEAVWEKGLLEALREYGVYIPREHESSLRSLLPAHAREWFDKPKKTWEELTPASAKGALVDDDRMLQVLAGPPGEFDVLRSEERFDIFARRATEDFGLPDPRDQEEGAWRVAATARLLCTEAAEAVPQEPPSEGERIVPPGLPRKRALDLLKRWQNHIQYIPAFERLVRDADATIGLAYWAKNVMRPPRSRCSRLVETTLFDQLVDRLDRMEEVDMLARELEQSAQDYKYRESGFWERLAAEKIGWRYLVQLAEVASHLVESGDVEEHWRTAADALEWYCRRGWQLDLAGEQLFQEEVALPPQLHRVRARLRRGYLRAMDRVSRAFSDLLATDASAVSKLPTAGEAVLAELKREDLPTALVFLDACRFDLGQRLARTLNRGEPAERASIAPAAAPIPSVTALGMALAMPIARGELKVYLSEDHQRFVVSAEGFAGDLTVAEQRRSWLKEKLGAKDSLDIEQVLDGETLKKATRARRLIAVHGREFDRHDGELQLTGAETHIERCAQAIRRLRDHGYSRVIVVSDHGFFHWEPEEHEILNKPEGEVLWLSRRAAVGRELAHPQALRMEVPCSDLEVLVPRGMSSFKTRGGLEFFHGGATLQELIIPVIVAIWPAKARKVGVVLKPVAHFASLAPRVQVQAGVVGQTTLFGDADLLSRQVVVKVRDPASGKAVFRHAEPVTVEPEGAPVTVELRLVEPTPDLAYNTALEVLVLDADDEEILAREETTLKVEIDEWR